MNYTMESYGSVPIVDFPKGHDTYRIFDKPAEGRMMITPSLGTAAAGGFLKGATLGISGPVSNGAVYREVALEFLAKSGRTCQVNEGYLLMDPQWEFRYVCPPQVANAGRR